MEFVAEMVALWVSLRNDPSDLKATMRRINLFLKRANFATENEYYVRLHQQIYG